MATSRQNVRLPLRIQPPIELIETKTGQIDQSISATPFEGVPFVALDPFFDTETDIDPKISQSISSSAFIVVP